MGYCRFLLPAVALGVGVVWAQPAETAGLETRELTPAPSTEVLFNPGMGLYLQYPPTDAQPDEWFMRLADIAYYRLDWNDVNPAPGQYTFDAYFGPLFDFWVRQRGKRVAFRVMCQSMHSPGAYVTPQWVFAAGVPGVQHEALNGVMQTDPVFWDDRYLDLQCEFIGRLGEYLDGRPGLEFVDIGSIGEWGEMHLARWTPEQLEATGFSETRYALAYRRVIDAYARAFPRTRVFLNVGGQDHLTINDYAALRGLHFRQDGLTPTGASYDCGEWLYKPYARRGVICNFEFHSSYESMLQKGWDVRATIEKGLSAPISYLNTNLFGGGGYRQAPAEVQQLLADAGRRVGYRFVITRLTVPTTARLAPGRASRVPLECVWRNDGVAPCYDSFAICWSLVDGAGQTVAEQTVLPRTPTTLWWPGETITEHAVLRLPPGLAPGEYGLRVRMLVPETGQNIMLGIAGRQPDGTYDLGKTAAKLTPEVSPNVYAEAFETPRGQWQAAEGITVRVTGQGGHREPGCLLVEGQAARTWNYAALRLPDLIPLAKYRLQAWMLVEELEPTRPAPFLKLGAYDKDGRWITNFNTTAYDITRMGTWQLLDGVADLPPGAVAGDLAIEKGDNTTPVKVRLRLDDVSLDLIEGP
ncbi:MAG: DUF4832 domain-containing protein [Armatimonadetes bacterium]|nr:DUF4832 domain-containing protein [Armatimonadota bacterium]